MAPSTSAQRQRRQPQQSQPSQPSQPRHRATIRTEIEANGNRDADDDASYSDINNFDGNQNEADDDDDEGLDDDDNNNDDGNDRAERIGIMVQRELTSLRSRVSSLQKKLARYALVEAPHARHLDIPVGLERFFQHELSLSQQATVAVAQFMDLIDRLYQSRNDGLAYFDNLNMLYEVSTRFQHISAQGKADILAAKLDSKARSALLVLTDQDKSDFRAVCNAIAATCTHRSLPKHSNASAPPLRSPSPAPPAAPAAPQHHESTPRHAASPGEGRRQARHSAERATPLFDRHARDADTDWRASDNDFDVFCGDADAGMSSDDGGHPLGIPRDDVDDHHDRAEQARPSSSSAAATPGRGRGKRVGSSTYYRPDRRHRNHTRNVRKALSQLRSNGGRFAAKTSLAASDGGDRASRPVEASDIGAGADADAARRTRDAAV